MASLVVSLVGLQPAASAVALATWTAVGSPTDRVVLLATPQVDKQAARLRDWWKRSAGMEAEVLPVSAQLQAKDGLEPAHRVVEGLVARTPADQEIVFCGDPGLNFAVAAIARHLPSHATYLHTDDERLHCRRIEDGRETWAEHPLQDLGFAALLELHGLGFEAMARDDARLPVDVREMLRVVEEKVPELTRRLLFGVRFKGTDIPRADLAYEARGRLYLLFVLESDRSPVVANIMTRLDSESGDPVKQALLQAVREVARIPQALNALRPRVTVWTTQRNIGDHARASGLEAFKAWAKGRQSLGQWLRTLTAPPGYQLLGATEDTSTTIPSLQGSDGGSGPALVVCLGADPSATLTSLATHRPRRVWILYDQRTPVVRVRAGRLRGDLPTIGATAAEFVPTDLLGRGITEWMATTGDALAEARVDISPGSKAQACALARTGIGQLWSLLPNRGVALPLREDDGAGVPLRGPGLVTVAQVMGGGLEDPGEDVTRISPDERQFLGILAECCDCILLDGGRLPRLSERHHGWCEHGTRELGRSRSQAADGLTQFTVTHGDRTATGTLPREGGYWLEQVVGHLVAQAGADEVRTGLKWAWPAEVRNYLKSVLGDAHGRIPHRAELDVAARFGHRLVAISCKSYVPSAIATPRREVEAVAAGGLGRFALPVLVVPTRPKTQRTMSTTGAQVLALGDVMKAATLRERLEQAFRSRSTLANA